MHVIAVVMPSVMNLVVCNAIVEGYSAVEETGPQSRKLVDASPGPLEKTFVIMTLLVHQHVVVRKKTVAWSNPEVVVHQHDPQLEPVLLIPLIGPE